MGVARSAGVWEEMGPHLAGPRGPSEGLGFFEHCGKPLEALSLKIPIQTSFLKVQDPDLSKRTGSGVGSEQVQGDQAQDERIWSQETDYAIQRLSVGEEGL